MTPNALAVLVPSLIECGFVAYNQPPKSWSTGGGRMMVEIGDTGPTSTFAPSRENSYDHYIRMMEEGRYSFVLSDGAMLCLKYEHQGDTITWHRYTYVPPVIDLDIADGETIDLLPAPVDYVHIPRRAMLRFEYDPSSQGDRHPFSHLHINSGECRIPVSGALNVKTFLYSIVDAFYPQHLDALGALLKPTQPAVSHIAASDMERLLVKVPL